MTRHFSSYWRKSAKKISCPAIFYELSASLRLKILKIVENHFYPPNPLPDGNLIPFFSHYEEFITRGSQVQREYNACLFATNYDEEAAAALLLENGFDYQRKNNNSKCTKPALVSITYNDEGIYLHFDKPTTDINTQLESAYEKMYNNFQLRLNRLYSKNDFTEIMQYQLITQGIRDFFTLNHHTLSLPKDYANAAVNGLKLFLDELLRPRNIPYEDIRRLKINSDYEWLDVPGMTLRGVTIFLPYEDFICTDRSIAQEMQNKQMRDNRVLSTLFEKYEAAGSVWTSSQDFTRDELYQYLSRNTLQAALDKGFITRPKRGVYRLSFLDSIEQEDEPPDEAEELIF